MTVMRAADVDWTDVAAMLRRMEPALLQPEFRDAVLRAAILCDVRARVQRNRADDADAVTPICGMPRVCIESPLRGDYERNVLYAEACMQDAIERDEAPFAGHLLYPRVLNDSDAHDRMAGISAHLTWLRVSDLVAVYIDLGVTDGMHEAMRVARERKLPVVERTLGYGWIEKIARSRRTRGF